MPDPVATLAARIATLHDQAIEAAEDYAQSPSEHIREFGAEIEQEFRAALAELKERAEMAAEALRELWLFCGRDQYYTDIELQRRIEAIIGAEHSVYHLPALSSPEGQNKP